MLHHIHHTVESVILGREVYSNQHLHARQGALELGPVSGEEFGLQVSFGVRVRLDQERQKDIRKVETRLGNQ